MPTRRIARTAFLGAAGCLAVAAGADAQQSSQFQAGPPSAQQAFAEPVVAPTAAQADFTQIDANVKTEYDTNVADSGAQLAAARHLKLADVLTEPRLDFALARPLGAEIVFLRGGAGYDYYAVNHVLDRERVNVAGGVNATAGICGGLATGSFSRAQSDLATVSPTVVSNTVDSYSLDANGQCRVGARFQPTLDVNEAWRENSNLFERPTNARTFSTTGGLGYVSPILGVFSLFGNYTQTVYTDAPVSSTNPVRPGYDAYTGGFRYDRHIGARLEGLASISFTSLDPFTTASPGFQGLTYSADLRWQLGPRFTLHGELLRATAPSYRINATYVINESYQGDLTWRTSERVSFRLTGVHTSNVYAGAALASGADITSDSISRVTGSAIFAPSRRLSFEVDVGQEQRDANLPGFGYSATRAGLQANVYY